MAHLTALPTEILQIILQDLPPESLVAVLRTSRGLNQVANAPIIWRHLCQTRFEYWEDWPTINAAFHGPLSKVDWRELFVTRILKGKATRTLLDGVIRVQKLRIARIDEIGKYGYDVKETLLKEINCPDDAEDVLARRYFATAILERIQRERAIRIWKGIGRQRDTFHEVPLEVALGAFDLFVRPGREADRTMEYLDDLADSVLQAHPGFKGLSTREQALTLASFLRDLGFRGVPEDVYGALHNSFICLALSTPPHEALPLQTVAIYCAVARRLSLNAAPCVFFTHVYSIVHPPPHTSLDGEYLPSADPRACIYLDPFRSSQEVSRTSLEDQLRQNGIRQADYNRFLGSDSTRELVGRTARNIARSVERIRHSELGAPGNPDGGGSFYTIQPDIYSAFYSSLWASFYLDNLQSTPHFHTDLHVPNIIAARRLQYLHFIQNHAQAHCIWDITLVEKYALPELAHTQAMLPTTETIEAIRQVDAEGKVARPRDESTRNVRFKVGQLFRHKRYSYEGVIIGWDTTCDATETWIARMGVEQLSHGMSQSFYNVL